jgi:hypothetical protein
MRIGLLTLFSEDNPGQFFQALATLNALRGLFGDATIEIPDIQHWEQASDPRSRRDMLLRPWRNAGRVARRAKYDRARAANFPVTGPKLVTADPFEGARAAGERGYDLLVVGSDATLYLWGPNRLTDNLPPLHWLPGLEGGPPRVMLSSCSHTVRYSDLTTRQKEIMSDAVKRFCFIAVRDPLTMELIEALGPAEGTPLHVSPDPTFSYEVDPAPARTFAADRRIRGGRPVCGLRIPWRTPLTDELAARLRKSFDVVDLSGNHRGCKPLPSLGPFEWSGIFSRFDLHVTTSFHETIFCLKQGVPVYSIEGHPSRFDPQTGKSKMYYVHEMFGTLERHYFNPYAADLAAEGVARRVLDTWKGFDGEAASRTALELGRKYTDIAAEMARTVAAKSGQVG